MNTKTKAKHKKVPCPLVGEDGNAFAILRRVVRAMKKHGQGEFVAEFSIKAMSGDYENLLRTALEYTYDPNDRDDEEAA